jgi:hypothetical protein
VEQRLARWLLLAHDRVGRDEFLLTQEFVAMMLAITRPAVTVVAGTLQRAGLIRIVADASRFWIAKSESASCECYRASTKRLEDART